MSKRIGREGVDVGGAGAYPVGSNNEFGGVTSLRLVHSSNDLKKVGDSDPSVLDEKNLDRKDVRQYFGLSASGGAGKKYSSVQYIADTEMLEEIRGVAKLAGMNLSEFFRCGIQASFDAGFQVERCAPKKRVGLAIYDEDLERIDALAKEAGSSRQAYITEAMRWVLAEIKMAADAEAGSDSLEQNGNEVRPGA